MCAKRLWLGFFTFIAFSAYHGALCAGQRNLVDNTTQLAVELAYIPDDHCMSLKQLEDVVQLAAFKAIVDGTERSGVILSSCDLHCLEHLFPAFMYALERTKDGDISKHVVVAANGLPGYLVCEAMRDKYKHRCVLDRFCGHKEPNTTAQVWSHGHAARMGFGSLSYSFALVQKLKWMREILKLNVSAMWLDMDVYVFRNPLPFLWRTPDADLMFSSESCDQGSRFDTDVALQVDGRHWNANCGVWLANPHPTALTFMDFWIQGFWNKLYVERRDGEFDQAVLNSFILDKRYSANKYNYVNNSMVADGMIQRPHDARVYKVTQMVFNNLCSGVCGCSPNWTWTAFTNLADGTLVCHTPQSHVDGWITMHFNCLGGVDKKLEFMKQYQKVKGQA
mmetsp:Transcript_16470/g.35606  ORF Transcript_16470/g.35606 Transcript_16470/m.35606 type:complete len:393 (-) Transcript_16470:218-1396(-)|eukprot:CAMPEP_0202898484 /NCGR_PEP_ID=MMETSP1392-20130828/6999_1 /ASSEMBLY_ACC=CAM_ASM_000868 /TAXON_ID=225041 /ORGANISM="Chlamydomonas chlamydogama, Strain SAG 11-48b" /LENGTH=392 /DNA_ID=CAMNT_0049584427 /DNA_START=140 /DNA_END=1318 /DNA_ORIENTATION=-